MSSKIEGSVTEINDSGDLVTDIPVEKISGLPSDDSVTVQFGGHETMGIHPSDHDQPMGTLVASTGKSGFLEIAIVGISVSEMLGIKVGEPIVVTH